MQTLSCETILVLAVPVPLTLKLFWQCYGKYYDIQGNLFLLDYKHGLLHVVLCAFRIMNYNTASVFNRLRFYQTLSLLPPDALEGSYAQLLRLLVSLTDLCMQ